MTVAVATRTKAAREFSFLIFFLIYGLTEPVISGPVSFPLILMFLGAVLILRSARQQSPSGPGVDGYQLRSSLRS